MKKIALTLAVCAALVMPVAANAYEQTVRTSAPSTESAFIVSDKDRSGSISLDEFSDYILSLEGKTQSDPARDFALMDLNKDNKLTLEEMSVGENINPVAFR